LISCRDIFAAAVTGDHLRASAEACIDIDMARSKQELEASRDLLRFVVQRVQREIEQIEADLASLSVPAKLDEEFFWDQVAPVLQIVPNCPSGRLHAILEAKGLRIPVGNLRTFLSRMGQRELLVQRQRPSGWALSDVAKAILVARSGE
jgi:hypothetical protein